MKQNRGVLFLLGGWGIGGAERVTIVLAEEFVKRGWTVGIAAYKFEDTSLLQGMSSLIKLLTMSGKRFSNNNKRLLSDFIKENGFDYIINGWCMPFSHTRFIRKAIGSLPVKLISLHHNVPNMNNRIAKAQNPFIKKLFQFISAINLFFVYHNSDAYVVLSESFKTIFKEFTNIKDTSRLHAISNPLTLQPLTVGLKENSILYVGRLEETQKRVSRIIDVWKILAPKFPDWHLDIVGDGPDRKAYEEQAKDIDRIEFHGFQNPREYYACSKILLLTSEFEGLPLVLVEALASKCVPLVLGTFSSVHDIVTGSNGIVAMPPFDTNRFSEILSDMLSHVEMIDSMAEVGARIGCRLSVAAIVNQWEELFRRI